MTHGQIVMGPETQYGGSKLSSIYQKQDPTTAL